MILPIIINPNDILRQKAKEVVDVKSKKTQQLIYNMAETMKKEDGIGLAAPQINESLRIVVVNATNKPLVLINPKITKKSWKKESGEEGCLSVPNVYGMVKRHKSIKVKFLNQRGKRVKIQAQDMLARVIQHEIDHLDGILFIDKAKEITHEKV